MIIVEVQDQNIAIGEEAAAEPYCQVVIQLPRSELDPILLSLAAREPVAADLQARAGSGDARNYRHHPASHRHR